MRAGQGSNTDNCELGAMYHWPGVNVSSGPANIAEPDNEIAKNNQAEIIFPLDIFFVWLIFFKITSDYYTIVRAQRRGMRHPFTADNRYCMHAGSDRGVIRLSDSVLSVIRNFDIYW